MNLYAYGFYREGILYVVPCFFLFFFLMRPLYSRVNKRFPVRKAGEVLKGQKGACCSHVGRRGPAAAIFWEGNNLRSHEELIHLHLPSQPAPGAGRTTHNTPQMSLSSRVHQLKLINIPPHAGDVLPAQRAAGQATAEHNKGSRSSGSRSPGQQVHLAGSREGHSVVLALLLTYYAGRAQLFTNGWQRGCSWRQSWAHCSQCSEKCKWGSMLVSGVPFSVGGKVSLLPPNTHPKQIAEAQCDRQAEIPVRNPRLFDGEARKSLSPLLSPDSIEMPDPREPPGR